jgi:metallo-beta-lactamase class B
VRAAEALAGGDPTRYGIPFICKTPAQARDFLLGSIKNGNGGKVFTGKAFDNLWYIGLGWVGAWVLKTSDGLILFDTLNNTDEVKTILLPGMKEFGLDPAQIKYIALTHGHGDHFGGAKYLQDTYKPHVLLSDLDWQLIEKRPTEAAEKLPGPTRDMVVKGGDTLTLGDVTIRFLLTPGHTPATVSSFIPVKDKGRPVLVTMAGGSAMWDDSRTTGQYHESFHKLWAAGREAGAEGVVSPHMVMNGGLEKLQQIKDHPDAPNPFVLGKDGYEQFMRVQDQCILANLARTTAWGR